ncbi:unnamed protein product [Prunus armeniaca]
MYFLFKFSQISFAVLYEQYISNNSLEIVGSFRWLELGKVGGEVENIKGGKHSFLPAFKENSIEGINLGNIRKFGDDIHGYTLKIVGNLGCGCSPLITNSRLRRVSHCL